MKTMRTTPNPHPLSLPIPRGWEEALTGWATSMRAAGYSERTVKTRCVYLRRVARDLGRESPERVTADDLLAWAGQQDWAPATRHSCYTSLRVFYRWLCGKGTIESNPALALPRVTCPPGVPRPVPREVLDHGIQGASDRVELMLYLAACSGLRASEIARVHASDVFEDLDGLSLVVHGKGGRTRVVPLPSWLGERVRAACDLGGGWAFPSKYGGHLSGARISELGSDALPGRWTLHTLRHRFATLAYRADRDLLAVQRLLGHASVHTTQRYAEPPGDALRRAIHAADIYQ